MISEADFLAAVLDGVLPTVAGSQADSPEGDDEDIMGGFGSLQPTGGDGGGSDDAPPIGSFARRLLGVSGFGMGEELDTVQVLSTSAAQDPGVRSLPPRLFYWRPTHTRRHHTLLVEVADPGSELLKDSLFQQERKEGRLEDAVHRLVQTVLRAFERRSQEAGAAVERAAQHDTLVVVSVLDDIKPSDATKLWRPAELTCFGTRWVKGKVQGTLPAGTGSLATFVIHEAARYWGDRGLAEDHLRPLYRRHFSKLAEGEGWRDAFVRTEERDLVEKLRLAWGQQQIGNTVADEVRGALRNLLDEIASSYGILRDKGKRVLSVPLPDDHDVGASEEVASRPGWHNHIQAARLFIAPQGTTVKKPRRLMGYLLVVVDHQTHFDTLRKQLEQSNRYHNVLVVSYGERLEVHLWQGRRPLVGRLVQGDGRSTFDGDMGIIHLLSRFFVVSRSSIGDSPKLAEELAYRARNLRRLALREIEREAAAGQGPLVKVRAKFSAQIAKLSPEEFADAYAQTLTYGMLAARWLSHARPDSFTREAVADLLPTTTPFLKALFLDLFKTEFDTNINWMVDDIISLLGRTAVKQVFASEDGEGPVKDPSIHFYEGFLDHYDPKLRKERGVYYTPDEVVAYIVESTHRTLKERFGLRLGLADTTTWREFAQRQGIEVPSGIDPEGPFVQILDPATGTGTFLLWVIEVIHREMMAEWGPEDPKRQERWRDYVRNSLLKRVSGFEILAAPYMVCHLRLGLKLQETGFTFGRGKEKAQERLQVYLTNTLEMLSTQQKIDDVDVARESEEAEVIKKNAPISVIVGNPPYEREAADAGGTHKGGWVRGGGWNGWKDGAPLLEDYSAPTRAAGRGGDLKNIYNLYVYFWRWAGWRVFDRYGTPGVVSFISASSYLRGPGFIGMREELRRSADEISILDLEGDLKGARKTANVFNPPDSTGITIPVCIGAAVAVMPNRAARPPVRYFRVTGLRSDKLEACKRWAELSATVPWIDALDGWQQPLLGGGSAVYHKWPEVIGLFPWNHTGAEFQRTWPIGETEEVLRRRWNTFLHAGDRGLAFSENRDRKIGNTYQPLFIDGVPQVPLSAEPVGAPAPLITRFGFRSFNSSWCFADNRIGTVLKPVLWNTIRDNNQVFLTSLLTGVLGTGPAATVSCHVPDKHYFCNRGGKDVIPLWRDPEATQPNIAAAFLDTLAAAHGQRPRPEDVFAYAYTILANPGYVRRFEEELQIPGPRLPVTKDRALFDRGAALGRSLLRWHTYGERFREEGDGFALTGSATESVPIPRTPEGYPERHRYDEATRTLHVGGGQVHPVAPEIMAFSVSGLQVLKSWLDYRMKNGAGKKSSPLDDIRPERWTDDLSRELLELLWVLEWTLAQYPVVDAWFEDVLASELFLANEIPPPTDAEKTEPAVRRGHQMDLGLPEDEA